MQREYEGSLNILLVECQNSAQENIDRLAIERKWLGTSAMWTKERPFHTGARGIPHCALLSAEGEIVLMGHPVRLHKQIEEHIAAFRRAKPRAPDDLPRELADPWKDAAKDRLGDAIAAIERLRQRPEGSVPDDVLAAAHQLLASIEADLAVRLQRARRAADEGHFSFARERAQELIDALGKASQAAEARAFVAELDDGALADEIAAEKKLRKIEERLFERGGDKATKKLLLRIADQHEDTKAAEQARRWADLIHT